MTATTVMKNCAMFQKRIALHETIYCSQSSEALGGFWSFLKLYMYIQIETFTYAITSHKQRRAEYQTEMLSRMAKQQFSYKQCFRQEALQCDGCQKWQHRVCTLTKRGLFGDPGTATYILKISEKKTSFPRKSQFKFDRSISNQNVSNDLPTI